MSITYARKKENSVQTKCERASSVLDLSLQNESLQRKANMANNAVQREEAPRPNNTGMPDNLKAGIESLSGFSMDDVRVHYNSSKPATVQALAYTQGTDIHVAPGQEKHLPHEAWHVAQQMAGRVSPTTNINGMPVNDNAALEHEANVMGAKAMQMKSDESKTVQRATIWNGVAQRVNVEDYYYHISGDGIGEDIDPMHLINKGWRSVRGDDLGPGFYMGDYNCLKKYYKENYIGYTEIHIYYIKKEELLRNLEIMDFTKGITKDDFGEDIDGVTPDKLFQIAMDLGFNKATETGDYPLDFLAPVPGKRNLGTFNEYVDKKYSEKEAKAIKRFFDVAKDKDIWMGYLNNTAEKNPDGTYKYTEQDENGETVMPIQIAIRKKDKIDDLLKNMKKNNHIYIDFLKGISTKNELTDKLKPVLTEIKNIAAK